MNEAGRVTGNVAAKLDAVPVFETHRVRVLLSARERGQDGQAANSAEVGQHFNRLVLAVPKRDAREAKRVLHDDSTRDPSEDAAVGQRDALGPPPALGHGLDRGTMPSCGHP